DANYTLQKQIATLERQNTLKQLENSNLALQNNYYQSDQYLELSARQNLGLAAPGEKEIIVPENVALNYIVPEPQAPAAKSSPETPVYPRNFQAWVDFFLHRPTTDLSGFPQGGLIDKLPPVCYHYPSCFPVAVSAATQISKPRSE